MKIAIMIPCYNEQQTIKKVITDYKSVLPNADIYVYDNNSTDNTAEIAAKAGAIVRYEYRQGKGNVIRTMFRDVDADCYLIVDGDDTYPAENAGEMCQLIIDGKADMVIGDRLSSTYFEQNKRIFHNFGNELVCKSINFILHKNIKDVMTGYRAFSPMFVKTFPILSKGFEIETEMTIHALDKNLMIKSLPVQYRDRPTGSESKLNTYIDGIKVLLTIFNLYRDYKPMIFFGILSFLMCIFSLILFTPIFVEYLHSGFVPRFPTLIVSIFFMTISLLSIVCGLILDTNASNSRRNFEIHMNIIKMMLKQK